ncbi:MAG: class I SAM-dependent methyltransferase, partial [Leptospiraceae bacterium]|nr:class I SAM-dependent methyltransferase [Leptospiraceae bacterium]
RCVLIVRASVSISAMIDKKQQNFDAIAPYYDALLWVTSGSTILRSQTALLPEIYERAKTIRSIAVIGGGTGAFLDALLNRWPESIPLPDVYSIDASERMLRISRARMARKHPDSLHRLYFIHRRLPWRTDKPPPGWPRFDLIITNYVLDCFDDATVAQVQSQLHQLLKTNGLWLCVDFYVQQPGRIRRVLARTIIRGLYLFFHITTGLRPTRLPAYDRFFSEHDYRLRAEKTHAFQLIRARLHEKKADAASRLTLK